ncbi:MAG: DUF2169 domain-containing protein [Desulfobacterales bacterium]|nr:DUF2169 domain-containing protein [Desulfobacterales bacterium]
MDVKNNSPFEFIGLPNYDKEGREVFTNIVKGTFLFSENQSLTVAEKQVPITMADEYWGEPGVSPIKYESDLAVLKPATDLILLGFAYHYKGKKIKKADVSFGVGSTRKKATVKSYQPADRLPLYLLENIGLKKSFFKSKNPNGFGFYPKQYKPRVQYAGTYDDRWRKERCPFLPKDFDYRFFQAAYPELITPKHLKGNERIFAENVSPDGPIEFNLPGINIRLKTIFEQKLIEENAMLDTVILEPEENQILLVWRQMIPCQGMTMEIRGFEINM